MHVIGFAMTLFALFRSNMSVSQITFLISVWLFIPFIDYADLKASNDKTTDVLPKEILINKLLMLRVDPAEF